jgi:hypothetical protein
MRKPDLHTSVKFLAFLVDGIDGENVVKDDAGSSRDHGQNLVITVWWIRTTT